MPKRTTLTLDDDIAARLAVEVRRSGRPFRAVVNAALRAGLDRPPAPPPAYRVKSRNLGIRPGIDLDDIEGLLDRVEGLSRR